MATTPELVRQMTDEQLNEWIKERAAQQQQQDPTPPTSSGSGPSTGGGAGNMMFMPRGYLQPPSLNDITNYDVWVKKLSFWEHTCGLDKSSMATLLINSMGNNCPLKKGLSEKFFQKYQSTVIEGANAFELVKNFLKKELAGNEIQKALSKWKGLEQCTRDDGESIEAFIDRFDSDFVSMSNANPTMNMPSEIKAFMLLERAKVIGLEEKMVQSRLNFSDKDTLYEQMELALREVLGVGPGKSVKQD